MLTSGRKRGRADEDGFSRKQQRVGVGLSVNSGEVIDITAATLNQARAWTVSPRGDVARSVSPSLFGAPKIEAGLEFGIAPRMNKYIAELDKMIEIGKKDGDPKNEKRDKRVAFLKSCMKDDHLQNCFQTMCAFINGAKHKSTFGSSPAPLSQAVAPIDAAHWDEKKWETYRSPIVILVSGGNVVTLFAVLIERAINRRGEDRRGEAIIPWTPGTFVPGRTVDGWAANAGLREVLRPVASSYFSDFDYSLVPNKENIINDLIGKGDSEGFYPEDALRRHQARFALGREGRKQSYRRHAELMSREPYQPPEPVHVGQGEQSGGFTLMRAKTAYLPAIESGQGIQLFPISGKVPANIYKLFPQVAKHSQYELLRSVEGPQKLAGSAYLTNLLIQRKSIEIETRLNVYMTLHWLKTALSGGRELPDALEREKLAGLVMGKEEVYDADDRAAQAENLMVYLNGVSNTMNAAIEHYPAISHRQGRLNDWNKICYDLARPAPPPDRRPGSSDIETFVLNTFGGLSQLVSSRGRTLLSGLSSLALQRFLVHDGMITPTVPITPANPDAPTQLGLNALMDYMTDAREVVNTELERSKATVGDVLMKDLAGRPYGSEEGGYIRHQRFLLYTRVAPATVVAVPGRPDRAAAEEIRVQNTTELPVPDGIRVTINTIVTDDGTAPSLIPAAAHPSRPAAAHPSSPAAAHPSSPAAPFGGGRKSRRRRRLGKKRRRARTRRPVRARRGRGRKTRGKQHSLHYKKTCRR